MPNDARIQRLTPEALGNTVSDDMSHTEIKYLGIAIFALILFAVTALAGFPPDDRKIVTASTTEGYAAAIHEDSPALKTQDPRGMAQLETREWQQGGASKRVADGNVQDLTY